jgi:hypothetical protein
MIIDPTIDGFAKLSNNLTTADKIAEAMSQKNVGGAVNAFAMSLFTAQTAEHKFGFAAYTLSTVLHYNLHAQFLALSNIAGILEELSQIVEELVAQGQKEHADQLCTLVATVAFRAENSALQNEWVGRHKQLGLGSTEATVA